MTLELRLVALATAIGEDIKNLTIAIGNLPSLNTTTKTNLVAAINEVLGNQGSLALLNTDSQTSLVAAINELEGEIGELEDLDTSTKTNLVAAINELKSAIDTLSAGAAGVYTNATPVPTTLGGIAAGTTFLDRTWQQMFTDLLYPYQAPSFSAFSFTGYTATLEIGQTTPANPNYTWSTTNASNIQPNSIEIQFPVGTAVHTGLANTGSFAGTLLAQTRNAADGPGTRVWRIRATNTQTNAFQRDLTVEWRWRRYNGNSAIAGPLTEAQIEALATSTLATSASATYTFPAASGTFKYIAAPLSFPLLTTFKDQSTNLDVPFEAPYTVSVTNAFGQTTDYRVYRTTNQLGAAINIVAS